MSDAGPAALVVVGCIVHIARLDPSRTVDTFGGGAGRRGPAHVSIGERFKHASDVIFASTAASGSRARLDASCSLVSLAVQSLRSM
ncbi:hypothetical protein GCM10022244_08630 [Streptomyces gulbargensis]|uniref:Uncharacterized protein n=1 Tax=Streptomyces gulbargensis TaxID=364901 RepID=A0ABP7LJ72_9ACTN